MAAVSPSGPTPSSPNDPGQAPSTDDSSTKIGSATKNAFAASHPSTERKKIAASYGDYAYIEIDKGPSDWLDILDKSIISVKESLCSLPEDLSTLLKKIYANLKKLWSAILVPSLTGMALISHTALKSLEMTGAKGAFVGLIALTKLFVFFTELLTQHDSARAKEKLTGALKLLALTLIIECDARVLKGEHQYFKEIFTGMDPRVALETLQNVKRLVSEALLSEWDLSLNPIKDLPAHPVDTINTYPTNPVNPINPDEPAV